MMTLGIGGGVAAAGPTTIVSDAFNRADSTTTMGNADTGQTWVPNSGTWGITSNQADHIVNTSQNTTIVDSGVSDCTVQVTFPSLQDGGICVRSTDDNNNFITSGTADHTLYRRQAGSFTSLGNFGAVNTRLKRLPPALNDNLILVINQIRSHALNHSTIPENFQVPEGNVERF